MVTRRVATPDSLAVFRRRYATRSSWGHGSVDWKSTATIGHRYAVSRGYGEFRLSSSERERGGVGALPP